MVWVIVVLVVLALAVALAVCAAAGGADDALGYDEAPRRRDRA